MAQTTAKMELGEGGAFGTPCCSSDRNSRTHQPRNTADVVYQAATLAAAALLLMTAAAL